VRTFLSQSRNLVSHDQGPVDEIAAGLGVRGETRLGNSLRDWAGNPLSKTEFLRLKLKGRFEGASAGGKKRGPGIVEKRNSLQKNGLNVRFYKGRLFWKSKNRRTVVLGGISGRLGKGQVLLRGSVAPSERGHCWFEQALKKETISKRRTLNSGKGGSTMEEKLFSSGTNPPNEHDFEGGEPDTSRLGGEKRVREKGNH